jgi:hypothetical protein
MRVPASEAADAEKADLPPGNGERFAGYGVMGLPFGSGHVLAMRRFPASSIGPAYTSVWHRGPDGRWVFWQDRRDDESCARYFSSEVSETRTTDIELGWPDDSTLRVAVPDAGFVWTATLASTRVTRALSAMGGAMPDRMWRSAPVLRVMGPVAGRALRAGNVAMVGTAPNGQHFIANPLRVWVIDESTATLGDEDFGPPGPLGEQARLGDFQIPQRGIFAIGRAFFDRTADTSA